MQASFPSRTSENVERARAGAIATKIHPGSRHHLSAVGRAPARARPASSRRTFAVDMV
jgi:hypothetical protein